MMYRQGDVLIANVGKLPSDARPVAHEDGSIVLARGEMGGHAHAISTPGVELFVGSRRGRLERFLVVAAGGATLEHEEHAPIRLPEGIYGVFRQREYREMMRTWSHVED